MARRTGQLSLGVVGAKDTRAIQAVTRVLRQSQNSCVQNTSRFLPFSVDMLESSTDESGVAESKPKVAAGEGAELVRSDDQNPLSSVDFNAEGAGNNSIIHQVLSSFESTTTAAPKRLTRIFTDSVAKKRRVRFLLSGVESTVLIPAGSKFVDLLEEAAIAEQEFPSERFSVCLMGTSTGGRLVDAAMRILAVIMPLFKEKSPSSIINELDAAYIPVLLLVLVIEKALTTQVNPSLLTDLLGIWNGISNVLTNESVSKTFVQGSSVYQCLLKLVSEPEIFYLASGRIIHQPLLTHFVYLYLSELTEETFRNGFTDITNDLAVLSRLSLTCLCKMFSSSSDTFSFFTEDQMRDYVRSVPVLGNIYQCLFDRHEFAALPVSKIDDRLTDISGDIDNTMALVSMRERLDTDAITRQKGQEFCRSLEDDGKGEKQFALQILSTYVTVINKPAQTRRTAHSSGTLEVDSKVSEFSRQLISFLIGLCFAHQTGKALTVAGLLKELKGYIGAFSDSERRQSVLAALRDIIDFQLPCINTYQLLNDNLRQMLLTLKQRGRLASLKSPEIPEELSLGISRAITNVTLRAAILQGLMVYIASIDPRDLNTVTEHCESALRVYTAPMLGQEVRSEAVRAADAQVADTHVLLARERRHRLRNSSEAMRTGASSVDALTVVDTGGEAKRAIDETIPESQEMKQKQDQNYAEKSWPFLFDVLRGLAILHWATHVYQGRLTLDQQFTRAKSVKADKFIAALLQCRDSHGGKPVYEIIAEIQCTEFSDDQKRELLFSAHSLMKSLSLKSFHRRSLKKKPKRYVFLERLLFEALDDRFYIEIKDHPFNSSAESSVGKYTEWNLFLHDIVPETGLDANSLREILGNHITTILLTYKEERQALQKAMASQMQSVRKFIASTPSRKTYVLQDSQNAAGREEASSKDIKEDAASTVHPLLAYKRNPSGAIQTDPEYARLHEGENDATHVVLAWIDLHYEATNISPSRFEELPLEGADKKDMAETEDGDDKRKISRRITRVGSAIDLTMMTQEQLRIEIEVLQVELDFLQKEKEELTRKSAGGGGAADTKRLDESIRWKQGEISQLEEKLLACQSITRCRSARVLTASGMKTPERRTSALPNAKSFSRVRSVVDLDEKSDSSHSSDRAEAARVDLFSTPLRSRYPASLSSSESASGTVVAVELPLPALPAKKSARIRQRAQVLLKVKQALYDEDIGSLSKETKDLFIAHLNRFKLTFNPSKEVYLNKLRQQLEEAYIEDANALIKLIDGALSEPLVQLAVLAGENYQQERSTQQTIRVVRTMSVVGFGAFSPVKRPVKDGDKMVELVQERSPRKEIEKSTEVSEAEFNRLKALCKEKATEIKTFQEKLHVTICLDLAELSDYLGEELSEENKSIEGSLKHAIELEYQGACFLSDYVSIFSLFAQHPEIVKKFNITMPQLTYATEKGELHFFNLSSYIEVLETSFALLQQAAELEAVFIAQTADLGTGGATESKGAGGEAVGSGTVSPLIIDHECLKQVKSQVEALVKVINDSHEEKDFDTVTEQKEKLNTALIQAVSLLKENLTADLHQAIRQVLTALGDDSMTEWGNFFPLDDKLSNASLMELVSIMLVCQKHKVSLPQSAPKSKKLADLKTYRERLESFLKCKDSFDTFSIVIAAPDVAVFNTAQSLAASAAEASEIIVNVNEDFLAVARRERSSSMQERWGADRSLSLLESFEADQHLLEFLQNTFETEFKAVLRDVNLAILCAVNQASTKYLTQIGALERMKAFVSTEKETKCFGAVELVLSKEKTPPQVMCRLKDMSHVFSPHAFKEMMRLFNAVLAQVDNNFSKRESTRGDSPLFTALKENFEKQMRHIIPDADFGRLYPQWINGGKTSIDQKESILDGEKFYHWLCQLVQTQVAARITAIKENDARFYLTAIPTDMLSHAKDSLEKLEKMLPFTRSTDTFPAELDESDEEDGRSVLSCATPSS